MDYLTLIPRSLLCLSILLLRSLLPLDLFFKKSLRNLWLYLRLSPHPPHFHASRLASALKLTSSHEHRSSVPRLQPWAMAWTSPAELMAERNAVSFIPENDMRREIERKREKKIDKIRIDIVIHYQWLIFCITHLAFQGELEKQAEEVDEEWKH